MSDPLDPLLRDLVAFVATPRPYAEVMEAWRTSCPRLPVWEEAIGRGLVAHDRQDGAAVVRATPAGRAFRAAP
jgi:hypothetical protein